MNFPVRPPPAEPERHRFKGEEVLRLMELGLIEDDKVELIDGDIVHMPAEGARHVDLKSSLNAFLVTRLQHIAGVACDSTLRLAETHWPSPDFYIFPMSTRASQTRGPDTLLVIEIADSSVAKDRKIKGPLYERYGVREYWLIDVDKGQTLVHRAGVADAWPIKPAAPFDTILIPLALPDLRIRIADHI